MAVTVSGKNYTQISSCDTATAGGTWSLTAVPDANHKEGTAAVCFNARQTSVVWYFTPSSSVNLLNKQFRFWYLCTTAGALLTESAGGMRVGFSDDAGSTIGYYNVAGSDTYEGGWYNIVIDTARTVDSGTKPTNMAAINRIYFWQQQSIAGKNTENTWIDNLNVCDGLVAYGDDSGGYFDFEHIFSADNLSLGIGILRKINGVYFSTGGLDFGDSAGTNSCKFQAKSQVLVFENRPVVSSLYAINIIDNGSGTTEFILGDKSGTAGIQGANIRVQSTSQTPKFSLLGGTDTDVDNFKLYASSIYGGGLISFPSASANVEILGSSFELCSQINPSSASVSDCFFINTSNTTSALLWNESIDISNCSFIANTSGAAIEMPGSAGSPYTYDSLTFSGNNYDVYNTSGTAIEIYKNNGSDPTTYTGTTVTFLGEAVTTQIIVKDASTSLVLENARVLVWVADGTYYPYQDSITITSSGTVATVTHTSHGLSTGDDVIINGAVQDTYNGAFSITVTGTNTYTYDLPSTATSPATGTIIATFALINELTNSSGIVTDIRPWDGSQDIIGWVRKSTSAPYYIQGSISGSVSPTSGFSAIIQLISDE